MSISAEIESMPGNPSAEPFPREESGLVNLEAYLPFLPDHADEVPPIVETNMPYHERMFVHQHIYFKRDVYRDLSLPQNAESKLRRFRECSYNQLAMRRNQELKVHLYYEGHVEPPPEVAVNGSLVDFDHLDIIGAATVGKAIALKPESLFILAPKAFPTDYSRGWSSTERADFFDSQREEALKALDKPVITPEIVVTSALKRLALALDDRELLKLADERLPEDSRYYPIRVPKPGRLYSIGHTMLSKAGGIRPMPQRRPEQSLQTGADELESKAA